MELLRREQFTSVTDYSPIARAFYRMDESVMDELCAVYCDIDSMLAKTQLIHVRPNFKYV